MSSFSSLKLSEPMVNNLSALGYDMMTPVQAQALPPIFQGKDVIAEAKTGSGKTVAFGIGVLNKIDVKNFKTQALILCPTRELADQVAKVLRQLARFTENIKILTLCGGVAFGPQLGSLRRPPHIVVGTPGRVLKHLKQASLNLKSVRSLVLDEADRMLDMGFIDDISTIISQSPKSRQTLLFSATYPDMIHQLSANIQSSPVHIQTQSEETANKVTEVFYDLKSTDKLMAAITLMAQHQPDNVIIFSNTKRVTQDIADKLNQAGVEALALHGDLEQYQRNDILIQFANQSCPVLVATDVAARGLDISDLSMVINYELPHDETTYTHRIGRTARAGKEGIAITLFNDRESYKAEQYRNETRQFESASSLNRNAKNTFTLKAPNLTLVIEGGKKDKVRPGDILGALSGDAGIEAKQVGKINVFDRQSYVAIERSQINKACQALKNGKIKARKFSVWILE